MSENDVRVLKCISASGHRKLSKIIDMNVVTSCHQCSEHHSCQYWVDPPIPGL